MEPHRLMDELCNVARKLGLRVRVEPFETPGVLAGGLCWLRGRQLILVDENAPMVDRARALAEALSTFPLEGIYMPPEVRRVVDQARHTLPGPCAAGAGGEADDTD